MSSSESNLAGLGVTDRPMHACVCVCVRTCGEFWLTYARKILYPLSLALFLLYFETKPYLIAQSGPELTVVPRLALNLQRPFPSLSNS